MTAPLVPELLALAALERGDADRRPEGSHRCRNCDAVLAGPYCSQCGQFDAPADPTLRELLADAWDAITNVDGKLASSLRLLLARPGALTLEFLAGRRVRYLPPFRLYLICSVAFFLLGAIPKPGHRAPGDLRTLTSAERAAEEAAERRADSVATARVDRAAAGVTGAPARPASAFEQRIARGNQRVKGRQQSVRAMIAKQVPNAMFVLMPVYAALLALLYRSRRRRYPVHLVFALHAHAFFFAALSLNELAEFGDGISRRIGTVAGLAVFGWILAYYPLAMRRVYGGRGWVATARAVTLGTVYATVALALCTAGIVAYLWYVGR